MSVRENIEIYHRFNPKTYLEILKDEYSAKDHPAEPGSYFIDDPGMSFYEPKEMDDHISVLGFNYALLSRLLIQAIVDHPELVPDETLVCWTQEQDLVLEKTTGELRGANDLLNDLRKNLNYLISPKEEYRSSRSTHIQKLENTLRKTGSGITQKKSPGSTGSSTSSKSSFLMGCYRQIALPFRLLQLP